MSIRPPAGASQSATSGSVSNGDLMAFKHIGAPDGNSGSFDYVADLLAGTVGTSVALDDSDEWVTTVAGWGYPVPMTTEDGIYEITIVSLGTANYSLGLQLIDSSGSTITAGAVGQIVGLAIADFAATKRGVLSFTLALPEGVHFDMNGAGNQRIALLIQRVGDVGPDFS